MWNRHGSLTTSAKTSAPASAPASASASASAFANASLSPTFGTTTFITTKLHDTTANIFSRKSIPLTSGHFALVSGHISTHGRRRLSF